MKYIAFMLSVAVPALSFTMPQAIHHMPTATNGPSRSALFMVAATNGDNPALTDAVLKEIEKKQAILNKKKEAALATANQAETTLIALESKKQEYLNGLKLKTPPGGSFSETTLRSIVKAFMWRIIAGSVTFVTSFQFSGSLITALSIVGSDFFSKAFTMFVGERLMNKSQAGRKAGSDAVGRSLMKALVWRLFAICNTLTMAVLIAKDLSIASKIAGSDAIFKTGLMFLYERVWAKIQWGKEYLIEFSI
jgi:uncharacterized membrane protein